LIRNGILSLLVVIILMNTAGAAGWDEMSAVNFAQPLGSSTVTYLAYNVTVIAQSDPDGLGPAYLLNGLSTSEYWYQIGVSYNWSYLNPVNGSTHFDGFQATYNIFDPNGTVVAPACEGNVCGGGTLNFSGPLYNGDKVLLSLNLSGGNVTLLAKDWNTGATATVSFSSYKAYGFEGTLFPQSSGRGTGLMTEWYHDSAFYYDPQNGPMFYQEQKVKYSPVGAMPIDGWLILYKICTTQDCLTYNQNLAYIIANMQGQEDSIVYNPKATQELTQKDLPYNFSGGDGQLDTLYPNGTFVTGTLNPVITTTVTSTTTSTTSTSSSTSTVATTVSTTTSETTSILEPQTTLTTVASAQPPEEHSPDILIYVVAAVAAMALLAAGLMKRKSQDKQKQTTDGEGNKLVAEVKGGSGNARDNEKRATKELQKTKKSSKNT
jgi:hypothetical protein